MKKVGGQLWNAMKPSKDGNRRSSSDEKAIQSTHTPDDAQAVQKDDAPEGKNMAVRPLHKLMNEILRHTATSSVQGEPRDQAVLGSLLKSFKNSSCLQELVETVHKICSQLWCKCSGGGDAKSTTVAVLNAVSHYSWEAKMVLVLAAFAVIYGEWWLLAEQTDPLSESIKLLKQLPDKSKLSKIGLLIDAIVKVTNTVVEVEVEVEVEVDVQTAVTLTVESVVVCTSQIIGLDDEYTEDDLSKLTENLVRMNTHLAGQLIVEGNVLRQTIDENAIRSTAAPDVMNKNNVGVSCTSEVKMGLDGKYTEDDVSKVTKKVVGMDTHLASQLQIGEQNGIRLTIDENAIRRTHAPDGKKADINPLHKLINQILMPSATTTVEGSPQDQDAVLDSHLKIFKNSSEELAKTLHKIIYQLRCKCWGGGDANSTTVALFKTLSRYSWEAKVVLVLAAFTVIYGECLLMAKQTNPLADSIKLLKQLPDKSKLSNIRCLIDAMVRVTNTIIEVIKVDDSSNHHNISTQIQTVVSWTSGCIVICTIQIIGIVGLDDEYTESDLSKLTKMIDGMNTHLGQLLTTWRQPIEEKTKQVDTNNDDVLEKMVNSMDGEKPLIQNKEQVTDVLRKQGLESSNLILAIDFTKSNERQGKKSFNNHCLHAIGNTPNPYEEAIGIIGATLASFAKDNLIPCYGFGDDTTKDQKVFSFHNDNTPCQGFKEVLKCYKKIVPDLKLSGDTSFAPAIDAAIDIVEKSGGQHHVLVIIADGQVTTTKDGASAPQGEQTIKSIVTASSYALSIVVVGVGDGPWDEMNKFSDKIPGRKFDNFQFVNFTDIMSRDVKPSEKEAQFALVALRKIPKQYKASKEHGFLGQTTGKAKKVVPLPRPTKHR